MGPLQFEVVQYRLKSEYGAESRLEPSRWKIVRWWRKPGADEEWRPEMPSDATLAEDRDGKPVILFADEWALRYFTKQNPAVELMEEPPMVAATAG